MEDFRGGLKAGWRGGKGVPAGGTRVRTCTEVRKEETCPERIRGERGYLGLGRG